MSAGKAGRPDEELAEVVEAELLGVIQGIDPSPVDDLPLAHHHAHEVQAEDADRVEDAFARPPLIEMPEARHQPRQERRPQRVAQITVGSVIASHPTPRSRRPSGRTRKISLDSIFNAIRRPDRDLPRSTSLVGRQVRHA